MSIGIQKQIKENSQDVSGARSDLSRWTEELEKQEVRRELRRRSDKGLPIPPALAKAKARAPTENEAVAEAAMKAVAQAAGVKTHDNDDTDAAEPIKRDGQAMHQYYNSWDQFDADAEGERLDEETLEQQRLERETRQADKDRILDEMAIQGDGDRSRTSKARPRVKVTVRTSGRRASPVDLAEPRKVEANGFFASGRYREAVTAYSVALDGLEKYEPPTCRGSQETAVFDNRELSEGNVGDCAGQETEALKLKATLLANRAAAFLKLEEWRLVVVDCSEALRFEPEHGKAILRRGFAHARMKRWLLASRDLERAVAWDPGDKKAAAELRMVRRMLEEQAKEAREHARRSMCDPTRQPAMPARRLIVRAQRPVAAGQNEHAGKGQVAASSSSSPPPVSSGSVATAPSPAAERKPYVPRAVRMRGGRSAVAVAGDAVQAVVDASGGGGGVGNASGSRASTSGAAPGAVMNFYTFEAQWARQRSRTPERLALLRRVGAGGLPALFRESLDPELLGSIAEVLSSEVGDAEAAGPTGAFAADVLAALVRTPRFDLSFDSLSQGERDATLALLGRLSAASQGDATVLHALRRRCEEAAMPRSRAEPEDEDDVEQEAVGQRFPLPAARDVAGSLAAVAARALDEATSVALAPPPAAAAGVAAFSLDDCD